MNQSNALKICYILKRYPRFSETFIVNEILALEAQGVDITIIAIKPPTEGVFHENLSRVKAAVTYLPTLSQSPSKFFSTLSSAFNEHGLASVGAFMDQDAADLEYGIKAARIAAEFGANVIHAHFATSAAAISRIASRLSGIPYTVTAHAKDIFHQDINFCALNARLSDAARVITVSNFNAHHLKTTFPHCGEKIIRIYNGMPLQSLPVRDHGNANHRILSVGRLIEKKGIRHLLHAVSLLKSSFPNLQCDIIGDGILRDSLTTLAFDLGISKVVKFHGILPQHEVHRFMVDADAFVAPCVVSEDGDRDGLPTVLLEAMAIGTPCISTPVTGIPEVIKDRVTGLLVPTHSPEAIAAACNTLFSDIQLSESLATSASHLISTSFDIQENTTALAQEWQSIANTSLERMA